MQAITYHTSGHENMTMLDKVIYVADYIEPGRKFPEVEEARKLAYTDINQALLFALKRTIQFLMEKRSDDLSINIPNIQCSYQGGNE